MKLLARAKINWCLDILGLRSDGYHELDGVMQSIELHDIVFMEKDDSVQVICPSIPDENIVERAANFFFEQTGILGGAYISVEKKIPVQAGLGGGSADAAATLLGLDLLYQTNLSEQLREMSVCIGADVPFCMAGGIARAKGVGERLTKVEPARDFPLVLVKPKVGLSTAEVFQLYDRVGGSGPDIGRLLTGLAKGDIREIRKGLGNSLEKASKTVCPQIAEAYELLYDLGAKAVCMTGSGPTVFRVFDTELGEVPRIRGFEVIQTTTCMAGVEILEN